MQGFIQTFFEVLKKLEDTHISYMVVGSMASITYGEPRMTHDLDVVIHISPKDAQKLELIFPYSTFYCPPLELMQAEIVHQGQFNLIHHDSGLKIDLVIRKNTEHAICEFSRKRRVPFWQGSEVFLASPEDIIIKKLEYYRLGGSEKHLKDIRGILAETELDEVYLTGWIEKLSLNKEWLLVAPADALL